MLEFLRRGVKTWVAKLLFGLLVISFAIWGIGDVFSNGLGSSVATVGEQKITAERYSSALNREIRAQSQRYGQVIDGQMARTLGLDQQVLARMAQEATLDQAMAELGISAPDAEVSRIITSDPSFADQEGRFDQESYRYALAQANFSVEAYEETTRRSIARAELAKALSAGALAPRGAVEAIYSYQTETRTVDYITLSGEAHGGEIAVAEEAALTEYYEENAEAFTAPETRSATFLHVSINSLSETVEPDEDELRALYDARSGDYDFPETRALYQIVFGTEEEATAAVDRIAAGEATFDTILEERGESRADASLGDVKRDDVVSAAGEAAFALKTEGIVGPVDTGFGFAVVDVAAITPAEIVPFEDARDELAVDLRRDGARDVAPEIAGEVDDLRASGMTLEEIAIEMDLPLRTANNIDRDGSGGDELTSSPAFLAELFEASEGEEREMIETPLGGYFVLRVDGITEPYVRPFEEVRQIVETAWRVTAVRSALEAKADEALQRIKGGAALSDIAAEYGVEVQSEGPKTRIEGWEAISPALVEALFEGEGIPSGRALVPGRLDAVTIAQVTAVADGADTAENRALREGLTSQMNAMAGDDALTLYMMGKQQEIGVTVNNQLIESLLSTAY
jgi:peptidyl-prolyl cis-trans isomerase D